MRAARGSSSMSFGFVRAAALVAALLLLPAWAAAAPLEVYGRLPSIEQAAISPDGAQVALVVTDGDKRSIAVLRLSDRKLVAGASVGETKVRDITWASSDHLLITASITSSPPMGILAPRQEWMLGADLDLKANALRPLLSGVPDSLNTIEGAPSVRIIAGKPVAFVEGTHFEQNEGRLALYRVDLDGGRALLAAEASENTFDWLVDQQGALLAEVEFDAGSAIWTLRMRQGGQWRALKTEHGDDFPDLLGLGRDGRSALIGVDAGARELAPDKSDWGELFAPGHGQVFLFDPADGRLIGYLDQTLDDQRYTFFDPRDQAGWDGAVKAFGGRRVSFVSISADHKKLIVLVDSSSNGPAYAFVDVGAGTSLWIGAEYAALTGSDIAEVRPLSFKAGDGLALHGYLTLPRGRDPKALPLIVFPHGGPADRDEPGFDWWAQAMASRGYAVLQVNYRGSDGYGWDFLSAGFGEWGGKMQTDLSDGVRWLAGQGLVDPNRVCIVGASYGGYAALAGAAFEPDLYRCAVSVAGTSDLRRFVAWSKAQHSVSTQRYWDRFMGAKGPGDPHLADISPADHADRIRGPVLLSHGKDDTVVPFEQSAIMLDALKKAGKPADLVVLDKEDHWLSRGSTRLQMLKAAMDFVERNDPP